MEALKKKLEGKKSYLMGGGLILMGLAVLFGLELDEKTMGAIGSILTGGGIAALKASGVRLAEPKPKAE